MGCGSPVTVCLPTVATNIGRAASTAWRCTAPRIHGEGSMVNVAARSHIAATLVFVASVLLLYGKAPAWCLVIALAAATWRLLVVGGRLPAPKARFGARFLLGVITAMLV